MHKISKNQTGFSVLEISMVLVIISLLVAASMVVADFLKSSRIDGQIIVLQKYDTSVATFVNKYNYLPGDMPSSVMASYSFNFDNDNAGGSPNSNGLIDSSLNIAGDYGHVVPEVNHFFTNMVDAEIVQGLNFVSANNEYLYFGGNIPFTADDENGIIPVSFNSKLYWFLGLTTDKDDEATITTSANFGDYATGYHLSPKEALAFDTKYDNGYPFFGRIIAIEVDKDQTDNGLVQSKDSYDCLALNGSDLIYDTDVVEKSCNILIESKFQF